MEGRIQSMTPAQTRTVCETALRLSIEWLKSQDVIQERCRTRGAMLDLRHDCYIGRTRVAFSVRAGEVCFGWLTWRLDAGFAPLGAPDAELRLMGRNVN